MRKTLFLLLLLGMAAAGYAQNSVVVRRHTSSSVSKPIAKNNTAKHNSRPAITASQRQAVNEILANMVYVDGGTFKRDYGNSHTVSSFSIGRYEVTQKEWKAIMGSNPSYFKGDDLPVEQVSWRDVEKFINRLNAISGRHFRLPTEAEWEFAARGGNKSHGYIYSGSDTPALVGWYQLNSGDCTHPVGRKKPNELGLYDMSGNVAEWCHDWWGNEYDDDGRAFVNYQGCPVNYQGRIHRGGDFTEGNVNYLKCVTRSNGNHNTRAKWLGFRLAI